MDYDSHNIVPFASTQVTTLTVAQAPMMPTIVPISFSPREKPEKLMDIILKGGNITCYST